MGLSPPLDIGPCILFIVVAGQEVTGRHVPNFVGHSVASIQERVPPGNLLLRLACPRRCGGPASGWSHALGNAGPSGVAEACRQRPDSYSKRLAPEHGLEP